jgi:GDP-mannose 6-dehydrogenase
MKISILGMGYVGAVSAACLAKKGHRVIGVDPNKSKIRLINEGKSPIVEKDVGDIIAATVEDGNLTATDNVNDAVNQTEMSLVCVGTPSQANGSLDLQYLRRVCEQIGTIIKDKDDFHVVVVRSTMLPGTMRDVAIPILEQNSNKKSGSGFGVCNNPEFLREGSAVYDFYNPPKTVIGESDNKAGDLLSSIYEGLPGPLIRTEIETAEMVKYCDNTWHAVKVCFGNEIGNICKEIGIDSHKVMDIFCQDVKLNLSPYYLKPGFAFGGSCLPKDLRALTYKAKMLDIDTPLLNSCMSSNNYQIERGVKMIMSKGYKKIGVLGFSFKEGTDDLRESPLVEVIERLLGKGYDIKIYDKNVNVARLVGANKDYILNVIPHISKLMVDSIDKVLQHGEVIVIGNKEKDFQKIIGRLTTGQVVVDLVRIKDQAQSGPSYEGICW